MKLWYLIEVLYSETLGTLDWYSIRVRILKRSKLLTDIWLKSRILKLCYLIEILNFETLETLDWFLIEVMNFETLDWYPIEVLNFDSLDWYSTEVLNFETFLMFYWSLRFWNLVNIWLNSCILLKLYWYLIEIFNSSTLDWYLKSCISKLLTDIRLKSILIKFSYFVASRILAVKPFSTPVNLLITTIIFFHQINGCQYYWLMKKVQLSSFVS